MTDKFGVNHERRGRPEGFHSARKNKGHPQREERIQRARERQDNRIVDEVDDHAGDAEGDTGE